MENILLESLDYLTIKMVNSLKKSNITSVYDLLLNYPTKFNDYTIQHIKDVTPETAVTIAGVAQSRPTVRSVRSNLKILNFYADVNGRHLRITIFNRQYLRTKIHYGVYVRLTGKLNKDLKSFVASEIHFDELSNNITPVFNITGIADERMLALKERVYHDYKEKLIDIIPTDIREEYRLIDFQSAVRYINIPENNKEIEEAIYRFKFEELLLYQLKIKYLLYMRKNHPAGIAIKFDKKLVSDFISKLPFTLTHDQETVCNEILTDISSPYQMNRLLQGEVGSGKTVIAAICLYAVITANYQGAIMVPTEVLVQQHYLTFNNLFKGLDIKIATLSSSLTVKERATIINDLKDGNIDIVIGTHSLFQKDVVFAALGLVITDEEHRLGVRQRLSIVGKGHLIDHLKMSATPIPRTLAISVLGESDISIIKMLPGEKKDPITKLLSSDKIHEVINHLKEIILSGQQAYIICPMIEESAVMDLRNATDIYEKYQLEFKDIGNVGLIHSRLKTEEKEAVMQAFAANEIQILVSTSVIEVGVNVVNATCILIYDADRFGIAQLHQMRGRVRRSDHQSYCYLISDTETETAINRLNLVANNTDGFILAEEDLLMRGPGDFFGEQQTGNVLFKMADLLLDKPILEETNSLADRIIKTGLLFNNPSYKLLLDIVHNNYITKKEMLN